MERRTREPDLQSRAFGIEKETTVSSPELAPPFCSRANAVPWGLHPLKVAQTGVGRDLMPLKPTVHVSC